MYRYFLVHDVKELITYSLGKAQRLLPFLAEVTDTILLQGDV